MVHLNPQGAFEIADMTAGSSVGSTVAGRSTREASRADGSENDEVATGGPRGEMVVAAGRAESVETCNVSNP